ncbi:MAG: hypothetical protein JWL62_3370 [Hyphomicrobiales bacterium]|nr:hypothetical protein [Hyphomicrobiales bacterium]
MCSYITETTAVVGSAKGPEGWVNVTSANVYFDHPYHAALDHALSIDFLSPDSSQRVAVELSAESARELVARILSALATGEAEHG